MIPVRLEDVVVDEKRETYLVLLDSDLRLDGSLTVGIGPFSALNISEKLGNDPEGHYDAQNLVPELLEDTEAEIRSIRLYRDERGRYRARATAFSLDEQTRETYETEVADALALAAETDAQLEVPPELLQNLQPEEAENPKAAQRLEAISNLRDELEEALGNENYERAERLKPKLHSEVRKLGVRVSNLQFDAASQARLDGWDGDGDGEGASSTSRRSQSTRDGQSSLTDF